MKANIKTIINPPEISKFQDIHITNFCQLNCKHCYLSPKNTAHMSLKTFIGVIEDFKETKHPIPNTNVILSGGEPLTHPDFPYFLNYLRSQKIPLMMSSNGILIPHYIHLFQPNDGIQISIDGDNDTHNYIRGEDVFANAENALYMLKKNKINHSITMAVSQENAHTIDTVIKLCKDTDTKTLNLTPFQPHPTTKLTPLKYDNWLKINQKVRAENKTLHIPKTCIQSGCIAGILGYSILPDGTYWDCSRNQKIIGHYPQKIKDCLSWQHIEKHKSIDPLITCCK